MTERDETTNTDGEDPNRPPADGPSPGGAGEPSSETGNSSQDKPGDSGGTDGKQSPN